MIQSQMADKAIEFRLAAMTCQYPATRDEAVSEIIGLRNRLAAALRQLRKLEALEAAGVDNWEGYDEAMQEYQARWPGDFGHEEIDHG